MMGWGQPEVRSKPLSQPLGAMGVLSLEIAIRVWEGLVALRVGLVNVGGVGLDGLDFRGLRPKWQLGQRATKR